MSWRGSGALATRPPSPLSVSSCSLCKANRLLSRTCLCPVPTRFRDASRNVLRFHPRVGSSPSGARLSGKQPLGEAAATPGEISGFTPGEAALMALVPCRGPQYVGVLCISIIGSIVAVLQRLYLELLIETRDITARPAAVRSGPRHRSRDAQPHPGECERGDAQSAG